MRLRSFLLFISFSALSATVFAHTVIDSVGVENQNGKKVILHKVALKENYYVIARRYNVKPQAVIKFNTSAVLHVGDVVKVPTDRPFLDQAPAAPVQPQAQQPQANTGEAGSIIQYKVAQHEYLYGIARRFNTTVEDIKKLNNMQSSNLTPGQLLNIRQGAGSQTQTQAPVTVQQNQPPVQQTPVTTQPAAPQSAVAANNGEAGTIIQYQVTKHEYLYSVARRFNSTVEDIKQRNNLKSNSLSAGMVLNILQGAATQAQVQVPVTAQQNQPPITTQPVQPQTAATANNGEAGTIIQYKVTKHEYLYSVARRFNSTVEDIKQRNNLKSNSLSAGMVLNILQGAATQTGGQQVTPQQGVIVQEKPIKTDTILPARRDTTNVANIADSLSEHHAPSRYGLFEKNEKGVATTLDDPTLDQNKKLILHRTAPIGTVIKITNPMTNRTTFAKVVGRFTDNESTKDVILVMTKSVAESLGALDKRFHVNISYGVSNE